MKVVMDTVRDRDTLNSDCTIDEVWLDFSHTVEPPPALAAVGARI